MPSISSAYGLALVLLLLAGCRSEKVAFQFRPVQPLAVQGDTASVEVIYKLVQANSSTHTTTISLSSRSFSPHLQRLTRVQTEQIQSHRQPIRIMQPYLVARQEHKATITSKKPQYRRPHHSTTKTDDVFFLGGIALVIGALVLGLTIGGGSGLLVGLALGVPGYLFLARGYVGSWRWK
ncbi:hypothetical protein [Hymenobacter norwichensis]|uniref:hypothetical protein n=1 Tax=Hymenobacter norwichensis TaxID=223903 RepID=UPI0003B3760B|nr:hypothetical protein [Hymenobacter norwichensis]